VNWSYVDTNRIGDHICYISDMSKFKSHYPEWHITRSLNDILVEIAESELEKGYGQSPK
jgi:CDP-paratose 2-epimerase